MLVQKHILLIGVADWNIETLKYSINSGLKITLIFNNNIVLEKDIQAKLNKVIVCDITNILLCVLHAQEINSKDKLDGVVTFTEYGLESATAIKTLLMINGNDLLPIILTKNKQLMREHLKKYAPEISVPYKLIHNKQELMDFWVAMGGAVIIKPTKGGGSINVKKIFSKDSIKSLNYDFTHETYMAELYIPGNDILNVETISYNGQHALIVIGLEKISTSVNSCCITDIILPAPNLSPELIERIFNAVRSFLNAIDVKNGINHTEIKIYNDKIYLIESQARIGGGYIWYMAQEYTKYKQIEMCTRLFAGEHITLPAKFNNDTGIMYHNIWILSNKPGRIKQIYGFESIKLHPNIIRLDINISIGQFISCSHDTTDLIGYAMLKGKDSNEINKIRLELRDKFYLVYDDESIIMVF